MNPQYRAKLRSFGLSFATLFTLSSPAWPAAYQGPRRTLPLLDTSTARPVSLLEALQEREKLETKASVIFSTTSSGELKDEQKRSAASVRSSRAASSSLSAVSTLVAHAPGAAASAPPLSSPQYHWPTDKIDSHSAAEQGAGKEDIYLRMTASSDTPLVTVEGQEFYEYWTSGGGKLQKDDEKPRKLNHNLSADNNNESSSLEPQQDPRNIVEVSVSGIASALPALYFPPDSDNDLLESSLLNSEEEEDKEAVSLPSVTVLPSWHDNFADDLNSFMESIIKRTKSKPDHVTSILYRIHRELPHLPKKLRVFFNKFFNLKNDHQPQELTIEGHKKDFLFASNPSPNHSFLGPLNQRIQNLEALLLRLTMHIALKDALVSLREYYLSYRKSLCDAPAQRKRARLLSLVSFQGESLDNAYFISEGVAYQLLCTDFYALPKTPTHLGSSPVVGFNGIHFKKNIRKASGEYTLNPAMEWAMYAFHQLFVGQGVPPSALLIVRHVTHKVPQENTKAFRRFTDAADRRTAAIDRKTAEQMLSHHPELQKELKETTQDYVVQASRTVSGQTLLKFLNDKQNPEVIDIVSFSSLMLTSLLMNPADGKADNYMVEEVPGQRPRLVSIDNDWALANMIIRSEKPPHHHFLEAKTILYCLRSLMDSPIPEEIRHKVLNHSPEILMLKWITSLKQQEIRYQHLLQQGILEQELYNGLSLPLRFYPGILVSVKNTLIKIQRALRQSSIRSHQDLFENVAPIVAAYYKGLTAEESPLSAFQSISNSEKTTLERVLPSKQESLKTETAQEGAYRRRTQTLEEAVTELLQTVDLAKQDSTIFLDLAINHWGEQIRTEPHLFQAIHPSWFDHRCLLQQLLLYDVSLPVKEFLINRLPQRCRRIVRKIKTLAENPLATTWDLSGNNIEYNEQILIIAFGILMNNTITNFNLADNNIKDNIKVLGIVCDILGNNTIASLNLANNKIGLVGANFLKLHFKANKSLTSLDLGGNDLKLAGVRAIEFAFRYHLNLTSLNLASNGIGDDGVKYLIQNLKDTKTITSLYLDDNAIGADAAKDISQILWHNYTLKNLSLTKNNIGNMGVAVIIDALEHNNSIIILELQDNGINADKIEKIKGALERNKILRLRSMEQWY